MNGRIKKNSEGVKDLWEAIEALNLALEHYEGTLIFVSHDREFVSSLATRIIEIKDRKLNDFKGTYDEFLASQLTNDK